MHDLIHLFHIVGKLKEVERRGWKRYIERVESVAEHSFRVAFVGMILAKKLGANVEKLIKMALIHDLPEAICGDITPYDNISINEKRKMEKEAITNLFSEIEGGGDYIKLWKEIEEEKSIEAKIVKEIDKFEMALQACEYAKKYPDIDFSEFLEYAEKMTENEYLLSLLKIMAEKC